MNTLSFEDIPISVIEGAVNGSNEAMEYILNHFKHYIRALSTRVITDEHGNKYCLVDEDMVSRLEAKLVFSIITGFEINY